MAKTEQTRRIEMALGYYSPRKLGGKKVNIWRQQFGAFEVPAVHGTTGGGLVDYVHVCEHFEEIGRDEDGTPLLESRILISCFEVKVSKKDFLSKNGHNFVGNLGFYAMPTELWREVKGLVPDHIGVVACPARYAQLRCVKQPKYRELTDSDQKWLLMSIFARKAKTNDENRGKALAMLAHIPHEKTREVRECLL
jgi:hypothetical protein